MTKQKDKAQKYELILIMFFSWSLVKVYKRINWQALGFL